MRLTFSSGPFVFLPCLAPCGLGSPLLWFFGCPPPLPFFFFFFVLSRFPRAPLVPFFPWFPAPGALGLGDLIFFPPSPRLVFFFFLFFFFLLRSAPPLSLAFSGFWPPGALGLGAVCCLFCWPPAPQLPVRFPLFCGSCLAFGCSLGVVAAPPPFLCLAVFVAASFCSLLFSFPLCAPVVSGVIWFPAPGALGLGAVWCLFCWPPASRLSVRSRLLCVSHLAVRCSLVVAAPPPPFVSPAFCRCRLVLRFLFIFLCSSAVLAACSPPPRCVRGALCCLMLPRCAALPCCVPCCSASPCCVVGCRALCGVCWGVCLCVVLRCWLLLRVLPRLWSCRPVGLFAVWLAALFWSALPCAMLCCVSLGALLRRAAARRASRCCAVVCCVVLLRLFGVAACCAVSSGTARRPGALCSAALCSVVLPRAVCSVLCVFSPGLLVRAVVRRCAVCCVCPCVSRCAFPVPSALCGAVFRCGGALESCCSCGACCCWRLVLWCAAVCCAVSFAVLWPCAGSGGPWLSAGGVFQCRCPCLVAWSSSLWLVWFAVVPCFPVSCSVVLCCLVVLCCCVLLWFCGAVSVSFALSSLCAFPSFVVPAWPLGAPWGWLLPLPPFCVSLFSSLRLFAPFCFLFRCAPPWSLALSGFRPRVPWALALCGVCFVGLLLPGSPCALASFVFPTWPFAALWWLLPPPPLLCLPLFVAAAWCCVFYLFFSARRRFSQPVPPPPGVCVVPCAV